MDNPRSLTILNVQSEFTFIWSPEDDSNIEKIIAKKIDLGFNFFIVGKQPYNKLVPSQKLIKNPDDILDDDLKAFILSSYAEATRTKFANMENSVLSKDVKLLSQSQSLAIRPLSKTATYYN